MQSSSLAGQTDAATSHRALVESRHLSTVPSPITICASVQRVDPATDELSPVSPRGIVRNNVLHAGTCSIRFAAEERALGAERRAYDAEVRFKDREKKLLRQCKQQAVDFQRRLTSAFEQRLQKIKIQHAQDMFVTKKSGVSSS